MPKEHHLGATTASAGNGAIQLGQKIIVAAGIHFIDPVREMAMPEQDPLAANGDHLLIGQFALGFRRVIIAMHGDHRGDGAKLVKDSELTYVAGVQKQVNALKDGKERWR